MVITVLKLVHQGGAEGVSKVHTPVLQRLEFVAGADARKRILVPQPERRVDAYIVLGIAGEDGQLFAGLVVDANQLFTRFGEIGIRRRIVHAEGVRTQIRAREIGVDQQAGVAIDAARVDCAGAVCHRHARCSARCRHAYGIGERDAREDSLALLGGRHKCK